MHYLSIKERLIVIGIVICLAIPFHLFIYELNVGFLVGLVSYQVIDHFIARARGLTRDGKKEPTLCQ